MDLSPGFILHNRYKIIRLLGQGGMGAVYLADDQSLANEVAVKVNRSTSPKAAAQFIAEARLLATLRHSNLPRVFDYFQEEGTGQFLVMDYIAGQDLKYLLEQHQVPPLDQVLAWAAQHFPHSQGPLDDGNDWHHDLQLQVEEGAWHSVTLTLSGSDRFAAEFLQAFPSPPA